MTKPHPSRTRWRIALGVVVFAAVAWLVAFPAYKRHRAIQEIHRLGVGVGRETVGPQWLRSWGVGFDRVVRVDLRNTKLTNNGLKHLSVLKHLQLLSLRDTEVNDNGLKHLGMLKELHVLMIGGTRITDDGIKTLQQTLPDCEIYWDGM